MQTIRWFEDISLRDTDSVGGKGANLGELTAGGLPVPPGFVVTGEAYLDAIGRARHPRNGWWRSWPRPAPRPRTTSTAWRPRRRTSCTRCAIPDDLAAGSSTRTSASETDVRVAVRSSGIGEDAEGTSFAGMNETFTNVAGTERAAGACRRLLGLAVGRPLHLLPRRQGSDRRAGHRRGGPGDGALRALRRDVHRRSLDRGDRPHRDRGRLRSGRGGREREVEPDTYVVARTGPVSSTPGSARSTSRSCVGPTARTSGWSSTRPRAAAGCSATRRSSRWHAWAWPSRHHYGSPQDTEWAMAGGRTYLVQSRPVTAVGGAAGALAAPGQGTLLVQGLAASAGRASGVVRVLQIAGRGRSPAVRRGPRGAHDESGLGPDHAPGRGRGDRRWRHDLPRRHRLA